VYKRQDSGRETRELTRFPLLESDTASTDLKPIFFQRFETHGSSRGFSS
jgi:hypothetical protein